MGVTTGHEIAALGIAFAAPDHYNRSTRAEGTHARPGGPGGHSEMLRDFRRGCPIRP